METILKIEQIEKYYGNRSSLTKALDTFFRGREGRVYRHHGSQWFRQNYFAKLHLHLG